MSDESTLEPELAEVEALLRNLDPADLMLDAPSADIWNQIEAELGDELETAPFDADEASSESGAVIHAPFGRRRAWTATFLAAAAAVVVVVAGFALIRTAAPTTVAETELAFDPATFDPLGVDSAANAALLDDDGAQLIEISDESLPFGAEEDADLELWLIRVDAGGVVDMVSLGDIDEDGAREFEVPPGYDPELYSVVDISVEPRDGDEAHSGRSILRGDLTA